MHNTTTIDTGEALSGSSKHIQLHVGTDTARCAHARVWVTSLPPCLTLSLPPSPCLLLALPPLLPSLTSRAAGAPTRKKAAMR